MISERAQAKSTTITEYFKKDIRFKGSFRKGLWSNQKTSKEFQISAIDFLTDIKPPVNFLTQAMNYTKIPLETRETLFIKPDLTLTHNELKEMCKDLFNRLNSLSLQNDYIKLSYIFNSNTQQIKAFALIPEVTFTLQPIKGFNAAANPLAMKLLRKKEEEFEAGYITLDQEHRLVLLESSDPNCIVYPLVGIWITGLPLPLLPNHKKSLLRKKLLRDKRVVAALLTFLLNEQIKLRVSNSARPLKFVLANFTGSPHFFEFYINENEAHNWVLLEETITLPCTSFKLTQNDGRKLSELLSKTKENVNPNGIGLRASSHFSNTKSALCDVTRSLKFEPRNQFALSKEQLINSPNEDIPRLGSVRKSKALRSSSRKTNKDAQIIKMTIENTKSIQMMQESILQLTQQVSQIKGAVIMAKSITTPRNIDQKEPTKNQCLLKESDKSIQVPKIIHPADLSITLPNENRILGYASTPTGTTQSLQVPRRLWEGKEESYTDVMYGVIVE